jgi:hypothetical protein
MAKGKYDWGNGRKVHKIPLATHQQNLEALKAFGGTTDLTAPPTPVQAVREANSAADLQYGPQVQAAQQLQANVAPWFRDYLSRVAGYAQAAQTLNAPVLQQAQAYQQGAATQAAPGLDPNSAAGQQSAQAAQGRGALAQLGLDALNTNAQATQDYFGGQQNMAARVLPQQQAAAQQNLANQQSQRGAAVQTFLTGARQNAQNYAIARGTLGLNTEKAQADAANEAASIEQTAKDKRAARAVTKRGQDIGHENAQARTDAAGAAINKYGYPTDQFQHFSQSHRQRIMDAYATKHASGADDKAAAKHASDVHAATGKVENQVTDLIGKWNSYVGQETDDTSKPVNDTSGKKPNTPGWKPTYAGRKLNPTEIRRLLGKDASPQMIHIALLRRVGKKLDQASIDYLHNLDPNFRIPRDWLPGDQRPGVTRPLDKKGSGSHPASRTGAGDFK